MKCHTIIIYPPTRSHEQHGSGFCQRPRCPSSRKFHSSWGSPWGGWLPVTQERPRNDQGMTGGPSFWWKFLVLCLSVGWSCHDLIWFDMFCFWLLCEFLSMLFGWFICLLIILYTNFRWFILIYLCLMMAWWSWLVKSILVYSVPYVWNDCHGKSCFFQSYPILIHVLVYDEVLIEVCFEMGGTLKRWVSFAGKFRKPPFRPFGILI